MNLYNDIDPKVCAWTQELVNSGLIPNGTVLCKSITDIQPDELDGYTQIHFFNGISGWARALDLAGFPTTRPVWCASLPCQPFSCAGKQLGQADERHLWPVFHKLVQACRPELIVGEQVQAAIGLGWLDGVFADLEAEGYSTGAVVLGAHSVGAPHIRQRLYWVAHNNLRRQLGSVNAGKCEPRMREGKFEGGCISSGMAHSCVGGCGAGLRESLGITPEPSTASRRLAHTDSEQTHPTEPGQCVPCEGLRVGGVADTELRRSEQCDQGQRAVQQFDANISNGGVADNPFGGLQNDRRHDEGDGAGRERMQREPCADCTDDIRIGLQHSVRSGLSPESSEQAGTCAGMCEGFWDGAIWHQCRDGKARRISPEPALFPLDYGLPGRVGLLRGAGNAIVPQVAAVFVKAVMEELA